VHSRDVNSIETDKEMNMNSMHGPMRRRDREITSRNDIDQILFTERVMHLAMVAENKPFLIPLYYAYDGVSLYFHSAKVGTKIDILRNNPQVCFEVCQDMGFIEADAACDFEAKHRTIIGSGTAIFIEDYASKEKILKKIIARFTDREFTLPESNVTCTAVIQINVQNIKGKSHGA
jgi:nitroimidazol reductase NimA-like FMN-containing flavoprotein (pyridoxamine 5'-phosphate oxidase superfamily)